MTAPRGDPAVARAFEREGALAPRQQRTGHEHEADHGRDARPGRGVGRHPARLQPVEERAHLIGTLARMGELAEPCEAQVSGRNGEDGQAQAATAATISRMKASERDAG